MTRVWFLAMVAVLTGCRQEEPAAKPAANALPQAAPAPAVPTAPDNRPVIACFGDSITAGFGLDPGQSFPSLLQQDLDHRGYKYRIANLGVSGDTTQDGVARLPGLMAEKPTIVLLELGANDGLRGLPVSVTRSNLEQIVVAVQNAGGRTILAGMTLPPNYGPEYIPMFEAVFRDLAARYKLTLIPFLLEGVAGSAGLMQKDGLHPNAAGARRVEETVRKAIEPFLKHTAP
ncbi:MAG TPA: arylesterase [Candidatus Acidoferrales bacterium]|jgi:acyl-CoA thioesterase-1|nr:arylesterase [Candidatus Acidoferrales bacterium]